MSPLRVSHVYHTPPTRTAGISPPSRQTAAKPHHTPPTRRPNRRTHAAQIAATRRGATCDARPTAGRQRNRPHVCVRHPGDMNVAPTFIPLYHTPPPAGPAFHRRHSGDMNVAPTCIPRLSHHARPAFRRRHPGDMNVAPTFTPRLSHATNPRSRHFAATRAT